MFFTMGPKSATSRRAEPQNTADIPGESAPARRRKKQQKKATATADFTAAGRSNEAAAVASLEAGLSRPKATARPAGQSTVVPAFSSTSSGSSDTDNSSQSESSLLTVQRSSVRSSSLEPAEIELELPRVAAATLAALQAAISAHGENATLSVRNGDGSHTVFTWTGTGDVTSRVRGQASVFVHSMVISDCGTKAVFDIAVPAGTPLVAYAHRKGLSRPILNLRGITVQEAESVWLTAASPIALERAPFTDSLPFVVDLTEITHVKGKFCGAAVIIEFIGWNNRILDRHELSSKELIEAEADSQELMAAAAQDDNSELPPGDAAARGAAAAPASQRPAQATQTRLVVGRLPAPGHPREAYAPDELRVLNFLKTHLNQPLDSTDYKVPLRTIVAASVANSQGNAGPATMRLQLLRLLVLEQQASKMAPETPAYADIRAKIFNFEVETRRTGDPLSIAEYLAAIRQYVGTSAEDRRQSLQRAFEALAEKEYEEAYVPLRVLYSELNRKPAFLASFCCAALGLNDLAMAYTALHDFLAIAPQMPGSRGPNVVNELRGTKLSVSVGFVISQFIVAALKLGLDDAVATLSTETLRYLDPTTCRALADVALEHQKPVLATGAYAAAVPLMEKQRDSGGLSQYARMLTEAGNYQQARDVLRRASVVDSSEPIARQLLEVLQRELHADATAAEPLLPHEMRDLYRQLAKGVFERIRRGASDWHRWLPIFTDAAVHAAPYKDGLRQMQAMCQQLPNRLVPLEQLLVLCCHAGDTHEARRCLDRAVAKHATAALSATLADAIRTYIHLTVEPREDEAADDATGYVLDVLARATKVRDVAGVLSLLDKLRALVAAPIAPQRDDDLDLPAAPLAAAAAPEPLAAKQDRPPGPSSAEVQAALQVSRHIAGSVAGGQLLRAVAQLDHALQRYPTHRIFYNQLMDVHSKLGNIPAAQARFTDAVARQLADASTYRTMVGVHVRADDLTAARDVLATMQDTSIAPDTATYQLLMGLCHRQNNLAAACDLLAHLQQSGTRGTPFIYNVVLTLAGVDHIDVVATTFRSMAAHAVLPDARTYTNLASLYYRAGLFEQGIAILGPADELPAAIWSHVAELHRKRRDYPKAQQLCDAYLQLPASDQDDDRKSHAWIVKAYCLINRNNAAFWRMDQERTFPITEPHIVRYHCALVFSQMAMTPAQANATQTRLEAALLENRNPASLRDVGAALAQLHSRTAELSS